jgi:hypothetical protein
VKDEVKRDTKKIIMERGSKGVVFIIYVLSFVSFSFPLLICTSLRTALNVENSFLDRCGYAPLGDV